ncbi:MAG: M20/M25/M40 family metallo-hydrolase [Chloroflexi bacterium]|nr:M20/M25/M40 family metallo-hydrolase [Chloroflexota bacterium]
MRARGKLDPLRERVADVIERDRQDLVDLALYLGGIASPAGHERHIAEAAVEWMKSNGIDAYVQPITETSANAIGVVRGVADGKSLAVDAHLDTGAPGPVGPGEMGKRMETGWVEGDMIYGHGIINCKAQVAAFMMAARTLKKAGIQLKGDLTVCAVAFETGGPSVDEHQGIQYPGEGMGTRWLIDRGIVPDYALVGETSEFTIVAAECGAAELKVTVPGRVVNTARLERGKAWHENPNSFERAGHVLLALEEWAKQYQEREKVRFYGGTIVPKAQVRSVRGGGRVGGGGNQCSIHLDVRIAPGKDPRLIQREIRDLTRSLGLECEVSLYQWNRGYIAQNAEPLIQAVTEAHRYVLGSEPAEPPPHTLSMWRDHNAFNEVGIPSICYGPPRLKEPYTDAQDRAMKIADLVAVSKVYALTAMAVCGVAGR